MTFYSRLVMSTKKLAILASSIRYNRRLNMTEDLHPTSDYSHKPMHGFNVMMGG